MTASARDTGLTVAVTGATGTFGFGLMPLLQADERVERVVGVARRPFHPAQHGWTKMDYVRTDVRDHDALERAFAGADVVVHLAFVITGRPGRSATRAINVDGTRNAIDAAAAAGASRFVYASSVAAYGFHADNPIGMREDWPVRPAAHLFYGQQKALTERMLHERSALTPDLGLYVLRPSVVLGPHSAGAKGLLPRALDPVARALAPLIGRLPLRPPALVPSLPLQLVHEADVGEALRLCILGTGPPGAYNIAADDILTFAQVVRELGFFAVPAPHAPVQALARLAAGLPFLPPTGEWAEAVSHPAVMDTTKARRELGWSPTYTALETLRDALGRAA